MFVNMYVRFLKTSHMSNSMFLPSAEGLHFSTFRDMLYMQCKYGDDTPVPGAGTRVTWTLGRVLSLHCGIKDLEGES